MSIAMKLGERIRRVDDMILSSPRWTRLARGYFAPMLGKDSRGQDGLGPEIVAQFIDRLLRDLRSWMKRAVERVVNRDIVRRLGYGVRYLPYTNLR